MSAFRPFMVPLSIPQRKARVKRTVVSAVVTQPGGGDNGGGETPTGLQPGDVVFSYEAGVTPFTSTLTRASDSSYRDSTGTLQYAAADVVRDDHYVWHPTENKWVRTLLVEQGTEQLLYNTNRLDTPAWAGTGATGVALQPGAPDGTATMQFLRENTNVGTHCNIRNITIGPNERYSVSGWFSKTVVGGRNLAIRLEGSQGSPWVTGNAPTVIIDLTTGTVLSNTGFTTPIFEDWGDKWRIKVTTLSATVSTAQTFDVVGWGFYIANGTAINYAGDGVSGFTWWGPQVEASTYVSSYKTVPSGLRVDAIRAEDILTLASVPEYGATWIQTSEYFDLETNAWVTEILYGAGSDPVPMLAGRAYRKITRTADFVLPVNGVANLGTAAAGTSTIFAEIPMLMGAVGAGTTALGAVVTVTSVDPNVILEWHTGDDLAVKGFTFTRSSSASYVDSSKIVQSGAASIDVARGNAYVNGVRGLLLEPARTNRALRSSVFSNSVWNAGANGCTVLSDFETDPAGFTGADRVLPGNGLSMPNSSTAGGVHQIISSMLASTPYTFSIFVKAEGATNSIRVRDSQTTGACAKVSLVDGSVIYEVGTSSDIAVSSESYPNNWWRLFATRLTGDFETTARVSIKPGFDVGNGVDGMWCWGGMIEQGWYATSFQSASTSVSTRQADTLTCPWPTTPQTMGIYMRFTQIDNGGTGNLLRIGTAGTAEQLNIASISRDGRFSLQHQSSGGTVTATHMGATGVLNDTREIMGLIHPDGSVEITAVTNNGVPDTSVRTAGITFDANWSDGTLTIASDTYAIHLRDLVITNDHPGLAFYRAKNK